jgi:hypothetical protein
MPTTIQLVCNTNNSLYNTIFASGQHDPNPTAIRTDGFQLHDLILDCNANGQTQRTGTNTGTWTGVATSGNNILISNVTFIHFGKQGNIENFPLILTPFEALDENGHLITLYSNITVEKCVFTNPATTNLTNSGGLTTGVIMPSYGQRLGDTGIFLNLTNAGFLSCTISNVQSDFGWTNGFAALSVQNCVVNGCGNAMYFEIGVGDPVYYGQSFLIEGNYFTNVDFGLLVSYNQVSQFPMAVGSITLLSNIIALDANQPANTYEAALAIDVLNNEAAIPEIPSVIAQFNNITTGVPGSPHWGLFLQNVAGALVTDNTFDDSFYAISTYNVRSMNQDDYALKMPLSYLSAARSKKASELVEITSHGTTSTVPPIGTQQKGDFNLDTCTDLLWRNTNTGQNVLWPMTNTNNITTCGPLASNGLVPLSGGWVISGTADFTGDCNNDILWAMPGTTNVLLWTMMGPSFICSNWLAALSNSASTYGIAGTGDFNGDGKPDIVITNAFGTTIRLMNGTQWIQDIPLSNGPPASAAQVVGVGEFTGSEQADILWRDYTSGSNFLWVMQGTNVLGTTNLVKQADVNWQIQGVGDFNGDGVADILWRHAVTGSNEIWLTSNPLSTNYTPVVLPQVTNLNWVIAGPR